MKDKIIINEEELMKLNRPVTKDDFTPTKLNVNIDYNYLYDLLTSDMNLITHPGQFHADEVFTIALILIARQAIVNASKPDPAEGLRPTVPYIKAVVNRFNIAGLRPEELRDYYYYDCILDLKNGHFDHHHDNPEERWFADEKFGFEPSKEHKMDAMATFGCVWYKIGKIFNIQGVEGSKNVYTELYKNFIREIDQIDNNGPKVAKSQIGKMISNMNMWTPYEYTRRYTPNDSDADLGTTPNFIEAVRLAISILHAEIVQTQNMFSAILNVQKKCKIETINDITYVKIPRVADDEEEPNVPLEAAEMIGADVLVNYNPSDRDGSFRIVMTNSSKLAFDQELFNIREHIDGMLFMHPARFIASFDSVEHLDEFINRLKRYDITNGETGETTGTVCF